MSYGSSKSWSGIIEPSSSSMESHVYESSSSGEICQDLYCVTGDFGSGSESAELMANGDFTQWAGDSGMGHYVTLTKVGSDWWLAVDGGQYASVPADGPCPPEGAWGDYDVTAGGCA